MVLTLLRLRGLRGELEALRRDSGVGPEAGVRIYLIDRTNHLV